jgi:hypothetical protein
MIYAGWAQGRLINRLDFWTNGKQQVFERQYIMHYESLPSGFESITVDRYKTGSGGADVFEGQTEYLSSLIKKKLYLARVTYTNHYQQIVTQLTIDWSANGVRATSKQIGNGRVGPAQEINLRATDYLKQNFDLWDSFGVRFD